MKNVNLFATTTVLFASLFFGSIAAAKSSVWKVSKGDDYIYLGGTIHLLSEEDHPLPEEFAQAYADAQEVVLETDLAGAGSADFQQRLFATMVYNDGRTLSSELNEGTYAKLEAFMEERQVPIEQFSPFQPWGVSLIISLEEYRALGMVPEYGVDAHFAEQANADDKTILSLETPDQQLEFLSSFADMDPNLAIEYTLRDLESVPELIGELKSAWHDGDLSQLENNSIAIQFKDDFPGVYETLLVSRNNNWMPQIIAMFGDDEKEIVLVGALHMVGEDGLIAQLEEQGFSVVQLD